jgi:hypothetical protein
MDSPYARMPEASPLFAAADKSLRDLKKAYLNENGSYLIEF